MRILTNRFQSVHVTTLSTLREHLNSISGPEWHFTIEKVRRDRVAIRGEKVIAGEKIQSVVILPAYPTGHPHDEPSNPNVVLDPVEFVHAETCEQREIFAPLLGNEALTHYDKMHPHAELSMTRCC